MQTISLLIAAVLLAGSCSATVYSPRITFSYVVDVTGSMSREITFVRQAISNSTSHLSHFKALGIDHFILVTFSDPANLNRIYEYYSLSTLYYGAQTLKATGGGDCPEYGFDGLLKAINASFPNSYIFYFSDASPKDSYLSSSVIAAAKAKNIRIWIIATGCCSETCSTYSPYISVATGTGGALFAVKENDLPAIMTFVNRNVRCRSMHHMHKPPITHSALLNWLRMHPDCPTPTGGPATYPPPPPRPSGGSAVSAGLLTVVMGTVASVLSFH